MARVWAGSKHGGSALLMLLAIADFADDDGNAYPSVATLATKCRMKPRNAQFVLRELRLSGELEVRENEGPRGTNLYRVTLAQGVQRLAGVQPATGAQSSAGMQAVAGMQAASGRGAEPCAEPLQRIAPEPSKNHQEPSGPVAELPSTRRSGIERPADVDPRVWADWLELRKTKKAPVTQTVLASLREEAQKAGLSLSMCLSECCLRGWQGFKAEWLQSGQTKQSAAAPRDWMQEAI